MPRLFFLLFSVFSVVLGGLNFTHAAEKITFLDKSSLKQSVLNTLEGHSFSALAFVDLNQDGLDDYILQSRDSGTHSTFTIIARSNDKLTTLGIIQAHSLMVSHKREDGVRNILAYQNDINDFEHEVYRWDINSLRYIDTRVRPESEAL